MALHIILETAGTLIVLFGLREVFRDIFHPTRSGSLSDFVGDAASFLMRYTPLRPAVGPIALVGTILGWVITINCGFALIYCGLAGQHALTFPGPLHVGAGRGFLRGLYFSLGAFDTFQTFQIEPRSGWLRLVISTEGLIGISMITASVSWLVLLYPALARMRRFAKRTSILVAAERTSGLSVVDHIGAPAIAELLVGIVQFRLDVILFPILLNFYAADKKASISSALPEIHCIAQRAIGADRARDGVFLSGLQLQIALEELAEVLAHRVVQANPKRVEQVFRAFQERNE